MFNYFTYDEFDSPDLPGSGKKYMSKEFIELLDQARELANISFTINSGYRTIKHNKKVGGSSNSSHLKGLAADIHCADNGKRMKILKALLQVGFERIGVAKTFIHVDIDTDKMTDRIWVY